MQKRELAITAIGAIAQERLAEQPAARLMGGTSRGLFLHLSSGWVVFVSPERFYGPLTLNCTPDTGILSNVEIGAPAVLAPGSITIPSAGFVIHTGLAVAWQAPGLPGEPLPPEQRVGQLIQVARQAFDPGRSSSVSALLPALLGLESRTSYEGNPLIAHLVGLERALREGGIEKLADRIHPLLGLGGGLTPSGDDVITGLLLAMARWGHVLAPELDCASLSRMLLPLAYRKTTTLSANMLECALSGQANERLILALDGIMCGEPDAQTCAAYLAGWGNTSGLDTLVGMAVGIQGFRPI